MQGIAYIDDNQITEMHAYRFEDKGNPRVEVEITPLGLL
jgi:Holliday junction resolvase RusA-like endonuclease